MAQHMPFHMGTIASMSCIGNLEEMCLVTVSKFWHFQKNICSTVLNYWILAKWLIQKWKLEKFTNSLELLPKKYKRSTVSHWRVNNINEEIFITFIDYSKTFDSISHDVIFQQWLWEEYID